MILDFVKTKENYLCVSYRIIFLLEFQANSSSIEDYDSAFEDESISQEGKEESCSRTTPNNHKTIRKWRQHSHPGGVKNNSKIGIHKNGHNHADISKGSNGFSHPSPFQPISIRTSSTVINETTHTSIPSPFDIDVNRLSPAGPLSAPSSFHWNNHHTATSLTHHRPNSTGGSTSSSSGCSSFLGGGPFSPSDSLFTSPGSNASSSGNSSGFQSSSSTSSSLLRDHDSILEHEQSLSPFTSGIRRPNNQHHNKTPIFRRTTTTVLTKTETVTSPEGSINDEAGGSTNVSTGTIDLSSVGNCRNSVKLPTTSGSNIPVGIAVARQRTSTACSTAGVSGAERNSVYDSDSAIQSVVNLASSELNRTQNLVKIASHTTSAAETLPNNIVSNSDGKLLNENTSNSDNALRSLPVATPFFNPWSPYSYIPGQSNPSSTNDSIALQSAAAASSLAAQAAFSPLGGYQVAKDPLTGQICFVPSPFNVTPQHPMIWPPSALAATLHHLSSPSMIPGPTSIPTLPPTYPIGLHAHQQQSYLEQLQRESHLFSAMTRNYSDPSTLATLGFPPPDATSGSTNNLISTPEHKKSENDQPLDLELPRSNGKENFESCNKTSLTTNGSTNNYGKHPNTTSDTKRNDPQHLKNLVVKMDPYEEEISIPQDCKKFKIDTLCQSDKNSKIPAKIELTNPITKQEKDFSCKSNVSLLQNNEIDLNTITQQKCKIERKSISEERKSNDDDLLSKEGDSSSVRSDDFNEGKMTVENVLPIRIPVPFKQLNAESKGTHSASRHEIEKFEKSRTNPSHILNADLCNGLNILAEGVERLEKRKESSDGSINVDSRLCSPESNSSRSNPSMNSPLDMLYDAAILKADHTTPTKGMKYGFISLEDETLNVGSGTGRSRSLDGQTVRKTSRRNSLCLSPDFGRGYRSPKAEQSIKAFIASKSKRGFTSPINGSPDGKRDSRDLVDGLTIEGSGKSPANMTYWENEMRSNLADIQKKYKEKYKELYKLDYQMKRIEAKNKKNRLSIGKDSSETEHEESQLTPTKSLALSPKKNYRLESANTTSIINKAISPSKSSPLPLHPDIIDAQLKEINKQKEYQNDIKKQGSSMDPKKSINELKTYPDLTHEKKQPKIVTEKHSSQDMKHKRCGRIVPIPNPPRAITNHGSMVNSNSNSTDLSAITSKFKVAKPNPFENLLRLSSKPSSIKSSDDDDLAISKESEESETGKRGIKELGDEVDPIEENVIIPLVKPILVKDVVDENEESLHSNNTIQKNNDKSHYRKRMMETYILKKPKRNSDLKEDTPITLDKSTEKSKHDTCKAFPMKSTNHLENSKHDNSIRTTSTNIKFKLKPTNSQLMENHKKSKVENTIQSDTENHKHDHIHSKKIETQGGDLDIARESNHEIKSKKNKKSKKAKKEKREGKSDKSERKKMKVLVKRSNQNCMDIVDQRNNINKASDTIESSISDDDLEALDESAYSCIVKESDLDEGTRVLVKLDGHFYPGKILAISPPDIYGIIVDRERGNRPHIFSREEVLKEAIFEVKPKSRHDIPAGTRVCAYWSEKYHHLFPGTVSEDNEDPKDKNYINIELDDGDDRAIHIKNIRYLPPDYPIVSCDNDPLASVSRRRRRQSIENFRNGDDAKCLSQRSSIEDVAVEERIAVAKRARYEMEKVEKTPTKCSPSKSSSDGKSATGRLKFTFKNTSSVGKQSVNKKKEVAKDADIEQSNSDDSQRVVKPVASRSKLTGKHGINRQHSTMKKNLEVSIFQTIHN